MIPARVGRYEILAELGRGAMGRVYQARDPIVGREIAIKTLHIEEFPKHQREEILARFNREAQAAGNLNHPHIVTIFDVGENYFVMELLRGETLQEQVSRRGRLTLEEALGIAAPIANALDYAHARGVVHRDVKPANIMMTARGVPKLMDFGLAHRDTTVLTRAGQTLGSPAYMAPEQIQGIEPTSRADLYALAVVTYEMLTGSRPFAGKSITIILHQVVHEAPVPPRHFNPSLPTRYDELFERALSKNPEERFGDGASFVTELNLKELEAIASLIAGPEPLARPAPPVEDEIHEAATMDAAATARPSASATGHRRKSRVSWTRRSLVFAVVCGGLAVLGAAALLPWMMTPTRVPLPIESLPSGALVSLDGVEVGMTPVTIAEAALGEHEIKIAKEGFVPVKESVNVGPDLAPLVFALQPARVSLSVTSTPTPASVFVDDEEVGATPLKDALLDEGSHRLEVRRQGFQPFRAELDARVGESLHYVARLQPTDAPRTVAAPKSEAPAPTETVPKVAELGDAGVVSPRKISGNFARYPEPARRRRVSGVVTVSMVISETGVPEELQVIESAHPILDGAVLAAIETWRFTPASRDGQPVRIRWRVRQHFRLEP